ncbi:inositol monophosphatase [Sphaerisporangium siamense]|uniref:inositol-phosphate phosphatase n=1 Tax=Sphaerisporangium siamense TaxID=795645 RepID=A0A7W7G8G2_9ACTN|nr:inositol monophosphatase family protein [Sphaerisporangium siamense]MBB4700267.1 myo-inositol-1(or 4)-monophosphatase [Sphaerisporangium siamense]GII87683.1 inositol monophosphatase [Sphaerisporangium siamense]
MTTDAHALLPIALHAVAVARELIRTTLPGILTAKGESDMATEVDYVVERAVRDHLARHTPILGVIDLPFLGSRYAATEGGGATVNGQPIKASDTTTLNAALVSIGDYSIGTHAEQRNRQRHAITRRLAARVQRIRMFGSAAIDLVWVAEGKIDACVMLANKPWDTAAGVIIAKEAGAHVTDIDGTPHTTRSRATIAAAPGILAGILALVGESEGPNA